MADIIYATEENFDNEITSGLTLLYFSAEWCAPCRLLKPVIQKISDEATGFKILKVDADENYEIAKKYGVMGIPTLFVVKDGKPVSEKGGYMLEEQLLNWINEYK